MRQSALKIFFFSFRDGKEVKEGKDIKFLRKGDVFEIEFLNVKLKSHAGKYELVTEGPKGKRYTKCDMKVIGKVLYFALH